jgi:hypothetical protein
MSTEAGPTKKPFLDRALVVAWGKDHKGIGWKDPRLRCEVDELPPIYFLDEHSSAWTGAGINGIGGQLGQFLPGTQNGGAASLWRSVCFTGPAGLQGISQGISSRDLKGQVYSDPKRFDFVNMTTKGRTYTHTGGIHTNQRPESTFSSWPTAAPNDGMDINPCWPMNNAPRDAGYTPLNIDPYNQGRIRPYDFNQPYAPPANGN